MDETAGPPTFKTLINSRMLKNMTPAIYTQYTKIVLKAIENTKLKLNKSQRNFMLEIFLLYLSIPSRINFLQLGRYSRYGEQRFRRQFEKRFEFFSFNSNLVKPFIGKRNALAIDPGFIHKSGKHTPGIEYFWSGCAGKALRGLEILGMSIIEATSRLSFHLQATQTLPVELLREQHLTLPDWYAGVIKHYLPLITSLTSYVVADAFFSKKGFVDKILDMGLHLVCKLRDDADLLYLSEKPATGKRGRPVKYAGKVDPNNIQPGYFKDVENSQGIQAKSAIVYSKSLQRNILVVIEVFVIKGKKSYRLLFSTDICLTPINVIDIYPRFLLEFGFCDAKQYAGLENAQSRSTNKLYFHFNAALTTVNIAKVMQLNDENRRVLPFFMRDYKTMFYNALLLQRFFSKFGIPPNSRNNQQYFKELLFFGTLAA